MPETVKHGFQKGTLVLLEGGQKGRLSNPRGCYCGKNGEQCWDIDFVDGEGKSTGGGIQAHGGTFQLEVPCDHDYRPLPEEALEDWEKKWWRPIFACSKCEHRRQVKHE